MDVSKKNPRKRTKKTTDALLETERWVWNALDVSSRYHLVSLVGDRGVDSAKATLQLLVAKLTGPPPAFITDGLREYGAALTEVYAVPPPTFAAKVLQEKYTYHTITMHEQYPPSIKAKRTAIHEFLKEISRNPNELRRKLVPEFTK